MMILTAVIIAAAIVGAAALFWKELLSFMKKAVSLIQKETGENVVGAQAFLERMENSFTQLSRNYVMQGSEWEEITVRKAVAEKDLPEELRNRCLTDGEIDITSDLEMKLSVSS